MNRLSVVLPLVLAACGALRQSGGPAPETLRLCVQNAAEGYGNIVAHAGMVRFDVQPGREVCKPLPGTGPSVQLRAATTGGGSSGPLTYATTLQVGGNYCWRWRLGSTRSSAIDLLPCDEAP